MPFYADRRVVITGLGIIAPNGTGKEAFWRATSSGVSGIRPIQRFSTTDLPIQVAGEVSAFNAEDYLDRKLANRTDRMTHFALAAVQEALQDARFDLSQEKPHRVGAVIANTFGGAEFVVEQVQAMHVRGPRYMSAFTAVAWLQVANVGQVSLRYGIQGYCKTPVNDTAGGLDALGMAYRAIQRGAADIIFAGGSEALLHPCILLMLNHTGLFATGNDPQSYRPFDYRASGLVLAEGAGICVLEEYEHALRRNAPIYGEVIAYAQTSDARFLQSLPTDGAHYARTIQQAMQEGNIQSTDIAYFSPVAHALPPFDQAEVNALQRVFGSYLPSLPISAPRTMLGHSFAAAGAIDTITALLALQHNLIPPTVHCEEFDPRYSLNLVRDTPQALSGPTVLLANRALTGANVVLAVHRI